MKRSGLRDHRLKLMLSAPFGLPLSISLLFISLLCNACEWKEPRRPRKSTALSDSGSQAKKSQTLDSPKSSANNSPKSTRATKAGSKARPPKQVAQVTQPKAQIIELLSPEEQLRQRDYLLTIDPDGPPLIHLKELTISSDVVNRAPKDTQSFIDRRQKYVFTYLRVRNFEKPQKIQIKWIHDEEIVQLDRLQVGISPRWRTWSSLRFNKTKKRLGEWRVEVSTGEGKLIGLTHFVRQKLSK